MSEPPLSPATAATRSRIAAPVLAALVFLCFAWLLKADFTWWDDQATLHQNRFMNPAGWGTLVYYWTTPEQGLYVPVTYTVWTAIASFASFTLPDEYGVFLNPLPFHLTNLAVHIASALLVLNILRRLFAREWPAFLGAAFFALHPIQVESVAWISGLKDLLGWFFTLWATLVYLRVAQDAQASGQPMLRRRWLPAVMTLMLLGVLSKPSALVLPALLVVIDWVILRRVTLARAIWNVLPLAPIALATAWFARGVQIVDFIFITPIPQRPLIAVDAICFYLGKILWPFNLAIDYGRTPQWVLGRGWTYVYAAIVVALAGLLYHQRKSDPRLIGAALLFLVAIAPVLGLTPFQMQFYSTTTDHYLYYALIAPAIGVAWIAWRWPGAATRGILLLLLAGLSVRTVQQTGVWQNSFTLFHHAMKVTPQSAMPYTNLAVMHLNSQPPRPDIAEPLVDKGYARNSTSYYSVDAYAATKLMLGKVDEAERAWVTIRNIILAHPDQPVTGAKMAMKIAVRYTATGELERANEWVEFALSLVPDARDALNLQSFLRKRFAEQAATRPTTNATTIPATVPATAPAATTSSAPLPASSPTR